MSQTVPGGEGLKSGLDSAARDQLASEVLKYERRVLTEADRLASGRDAGNHRDPITPHDIASAASNVNGLPEAHEQPREAVVSRVLSYIMAILAGIIASNIDPIDIEAIGLIFVATVGALMVWYGEQSRKKDRR